jgi:hypothetical protein
MSHGIDSVVLSQALQQPRVFSFAAHTHHHHSQYGICTIQDRQLTHRAHTTVANKGGVHILIYISWRATETFSNVLDM